jgi:hypothetical protein
LLNIYPFYTNAVEMANNIIYIWSSWSVYWYGKVKAPLAMSLVKDIYFDDAQLITALYYTNGSLYVAYRIRGTGDYAIRQVSIQDWNYGESWYVETITFDWWDIETTKSNSRLIVWYKLPASTSIDVYARIDNDKYIVFDISSYTLKPNKWDTYVYWWIEYTVVEFIEAKNQIVCTREVYWWEYEGIIWGSGTMTSVLATWDATYPVVNVDHYQYITTITDTKKNKANIQYMKEWLEMSIKCVLNTTNQFSTPTLYSIKTLFDFIDPQNG